VSDEKAFVQDVVVAEYYAEGFLRDLIRTGQLTRKETPSDNTARFAAYYGAERLPAELEAFLQMRDAYNLGYARLAEWRIWDEDVWLPDPEKEIWPSRSSQWTSGTISDLACLRSSVVFSQPYQGRLQTALCAPS
jgi:hypothetical protein